MKTKKFQTRSLSVEAIQMLPHDYNLSEKDREENTRVIAQFIENHGGVIVDFDPEHLVFDAQNDIHYWDVLPRRWVVASEEGLMVFLPEDFDLLFEPQKEERPKIEIHVNQVQFPSGGGPATISPAMMSQIQQSQIRRSYLI